MIRMEQYELIRTAHRVYQKSIRQIAQETGHHRETIRKALAGVEPGYRRQQAVVCRVMGAVETIVEHWLKQDLEQPRKQRHTARRVYQRLVEEYQFGGAESTVRRWVRHCKARLGIGGSQAVVPLEAEVAREGEVDWGNAVVVMEGRSQPIRYFCLRSRYSGKIFVRAYPWERQEMFLDGHLHGFAHFGGVFPVMVYDNLKAAVKQILCGKGRVEQERFVAFRSYYTFQARFCNPQRGQEKGGVEGLIGYARRNFLVPVPEVNNFEELNRWLLERCVAHSQNRIGGREDSRSIEQRAEEEKPGLLPLPDTPFEISKMLEVRISRYQTAQVDRNRYSVPTAYVGRPCRVQVSCERVRIYSEGQQIANHRRIFGNSRWQIDPLHYLELVRQRVGAFDSARPIRQWRQQWPAAYETLLSLLRQKRGDNQGTREFVKVLQLHQQHRACEIELAVSQALQYQTYSYEAVKHLLIRQQSARIELPALSAELIPGITDRAVGQSDVNGYDQLLEGGVE
jgi:transposase